MNIPNNLNSKLRILGGVGCGVWCVFLHEKNAATVHILLPVV